MKISLHKLLSASLFVFLIPALSSAQLFEDFESGSKGVYSSGTVKLGTGTWMFDDALIGTLDSDKKRGSQSARIRNGHIAMKFDTFGAGEVRFNFAHFGGDNNGRIQLQYSQDQGISWTDASDELTPSRELQLAVIDVNKNGEIRFRIITSDGTSDRVNIDHFEVTSFVEENENPRLRTEVAGNIVLSGATMDFGYVLMGRSRGKSLKLINAGQADLSIYSVRLTGNGYSLDGRVPDELEPGATADLTLVFESSGEGTQNGKFIIETNDPDKPTFETNLTGNGIDPDPIAIADARDLPLGTLVTVSGWVMVSDQFSGPIYLQDETAGIASYYDPVMRDEELGFTLEVSEGDSVVVTGPMNEFNGLLQISPNNDYDEVFYDIYPEGRRDIPPTVITLSELKSGEYEGRLVQVNNVRIFNQGQFFGDSNYSIGYETADSKIRISRHTDIPGMNIPFDEINIVGVSGHYNSGSNAYSAQLLPRDRSDFNAIGDAPFIISNAPYEVSATSSSITFYWETDRKGTSEIRYGLTGKFELGNVEDDKYKTSHNLALDDLEPATVYSIQLRSAFGDDTTRTSTHLVTTSSPEGTTQEINVYFSQNVDHRLATFEKATANYNFSDHLINRIDDANHSLKLAFYSISGTVGDNIASALLAAQDRGVAVRVIVDHGTDTDNFVNALESSDVPVIKSNFGIANRNQVGIHHNKYAIIDYSGGKPDEVWLITSSWNATDSGTSDQYQNMIEFQDVAIAGAYTREFNQKWGSNTTTPDASQALFGSRKQVVNPTTFWIGDSYVRLYFSPQGNTEAAIIDGINSAEHTVNIGMMLITRVGITNALFNRNALGVTIRGVLGQPGQQGSQIRALTEFVDLHTQTNPLLHHKYAIIDGEEAEWHGKVITGSHNWSASANQRNDENTIIIQDARIANLYIQEFAARYHQAGGKDDIITMDRESIALPSRFRVHQNYPNPFNPITRIAIELPRQSNVTFRVYDTIGRKVAEPLTNETLPAGSHYLNFDGSSLAGGVYIYRVQLNDGQSATKTMTLIK